MNEKSQIVSEYKPGRNGNYKEICEKFSLKKSQLYNVVSKVKKEIDVEHILNRLKNTNDKTDEVYKISWDLKISKSYIYQLIQNENLEV